MVGELRPQTKEPECWTGAPAHLGEARDQQPSGLVPQPGRWLDHFALAIETEVVPRLLRARGNGRAGAASRAVDGPKPNQNEIRAFAQILLSRDGAGADAFIAESQTRGISLETIYLHLMAPAARLLGDMWTDDQCSFTEVTLGLWRMQQVMRNLSAAFQANACPTDPDSQILLVPVPGEQHTFGLLMVADFFRRAGWNVWSMPLASRESLVEMVHDESFAVIGFSLGAEKQIDELARSIRTVRRASRNRSVGVMVGGPVFVEHPEFVARVGADMTAVDGKQAPALARTLVASLAVR